MDAAEIPLKAPSISPDVPASETEQVERALIDASTRVPVLMFYTSAIVWLLIGTLLAMFVSIKLHSPDFPPVFGDQLHDLGPGSSGAR